MPRGPRNEKVLELRRQNQDDGLPQLSIGEWRQTPDCREYARRYQVFTLLGWYHQNVVKPELTLRAWFKRLFWRVTGQRTKLLDPWEQLRLQDAWEERQRAIEEAMEEAR